MHDQGMPKVFKVTQIGFDLITLIVVIPIALFAAGFAPYAMLEGAAQIIDGFEPLDCPAQTKSGPPENCDDVKEMAYALATEKKGYADVRGQRGVPDVMERPYVINLNDCSTGNAHAACMFNDSCTAQYGEVLGLRSMSERHATVMYQGKDGTRFECDFTPQSSGLFIMSNSDTEVGPAMPDAGESMDPAYTCTMNGANTQPLHPSTITEPPEGSEEPPSDEEESTDITIAPNDDPEHFTVVSG
jgi:hypothetical protein